MITKDLLNKNEETIQNKESEYQDLKFDRLFTYYAGKGIKLKEETFRKNLGLLTNDGKYNILAQLLSDNSCIPIRLSIFLGKTKASELYSVKEFGNTNILISLNNLLEYADVLNIIQTDETNRKLTRDEFPLFNLDAFREALINAFVHNKWINLDAPMISVFSDRIEILSRGTIDKKQTVEGFFLVNQYLLIKVCQIFFCNCILVKGQVVEFLK